MQSARAGGARTQQVSMDAVACAPAQACGVPSPWRCVVARQTTGRQDDTGPCPCAREAAVMTENCVRSSGLCCKARSDACHSAVSEAKNGTPDTLAVRVEHRSSVETLQEHL